MASPYDAQYNDIVSRITYYANLYGINPAIGVKQLWQESRFSPTACSRAGACGIAQFIAGTASRYGVNRNNIDSSLDGWGRYMRDLLAMFGGRYDLALAGYNWGENRPELRNAFAENRAIRTMPSETRNYLRIILGSDGISYGSGGGIGTIFPDFRTSETSETSQTLLYGLGLVLLVLIIDR